MHIPALKKEVIEYLDVQSNRNYIDCTFGLGGHSTAILEGSAPGGRVLGIETDSELVERFKSSAFAQASAFTKVSADKTADRQIPNIVNRLLVVNDSYRNLKRIIEAYSFKPVLGILFDLGMSTWHLRESGRGFSFLKDEPLIMRYGHHKELTAEIIVNNWPQEDIEQILKEYGEERFAVNIAEAIVTMRKTRPIERTIQLVEIIKNSVPRWYLKGRIHCATKTFQALRIATNHELEAVREALPQALESIEREGRVAVISFHSLEDRIVKTLFRQWENDGVGHSITKKPAMASQSEKKTNPASRSAKLRAFQKD